MNNKIRLFFIFFMIIGVCRAGYYNGLRMAGVEPLNDKEMTLGSLPYHCSKYVGYLDIDKNILESLTSSKNVHNNLMKTDLKIISNCQKDLTILKITNVIFPMLNDFLYNRNMRQNLIKHNHMNELANKQSAFFQGRKYENVTNLNF